MEPNTVCKVCKKSYFRVHGLSKICSFECQKKDKSESDKKYREKNRDKIIQQKKIAYRAGVEKTCKECGERFQRPNYTSPKYCSRKCFAKSSKKTRVGKGNPYWRGGHSNLSYNRVFREYIEKTMDITLDQLGCQICKRKTGIVLDRHHIMFKSKYGRHPEINNVENLIQVCRGCHLHLHGLGKKINDNLKKERGLYKLFGVYEPIELDNI